MQSKGAVKLFAILMALVCLYQLSFTWVTKHVENKAREFANGDPVKEKAYLDSVSTLEAYPVFGTSYKKCKENEINLGLDLKGGMSNYSNDGTFNAALANAQKAQTNSQADFVTLFGEEFKKLDPNAR